MHISRAERTCDWMVFSMVVLTTWKKVNITLVGSDVLEAYLKDLLKRNLKTQDKLPGNDCVTKSVSIRFPTIWIGKRCIQLAYPINVDPNQCSSPIWFEEHTTQSEYILYQRHTFPFLNTLFRIFLLFTFKLLIKSLTVILSRDCNFSLYRTNTLYRNSLGRLV